MTIQQTIDIPANHRLTLEVPQEVPAGPVIITFTPAPDLRSAEPVGMSDEEFEEHKKQCPAYAENPPFNAVSMAAKAEADAVWRGDIPGTWYKTPAEVWKAIHED
jgi:hypothetical protein